MDDLVNSQDSTSSLCSIKTRENFLVGIVLCKWEKTERKT